MISIHIILLFDILSIENIISEYSIPSIFINLFHEKKDGNLIFASEINRDYIEILSFFALWHLYFIRESLEDY